MIKLKESRCPKCNKEIEELNYFSDVAVTQTFDGDDYSAIEDYGEHSKEEFCCPECNATLFTDEQSARNFLRGLK